MQALTTRQPWAWLIANGYKPLENKHTRPPVSLPVGSRFALHVSSWWNRDAVHTALLTSPAGPEMLHKMSYRDGFLTDLLDEMQAQCGRVISTQRLSGWCKPCPTADDPERAMVDFLEAPQNNGRSNFFATWALMDSPWSIAAYPVKWGLDDVIALPVVVGGVPLAPGNEWRWCICAEIDPADMPCIVCEARSAPIRGQVFPFALSAEVAAEVMRQELAAQVRL